MARFTFVNSLSWITKVMIFPFFYFGSFLLALTLISYTTGSFQVNLGETIEGIAIGVIFLAPILLLIAIPIIYLILKLKHSTHLLKNDRFLAYLGMGTAVTCVLFFLILEWLISVF